MSGTSSSFLTKSIILLALVLLAFGGSTYAGKELGRKIMDVTRSNLDSRNLAVNSTEQVAEDNDFFINPTGGRDTFGFDGDGFGNNPFPREWADPAEEELETVSDDARVVINLLEPSADDTVDNGDNADTAVDGTDSSGNLFELGSGADDATYRIQVGTFSASENAEIVWSSLIQAGFDASISTYTDDDQVMYRVQVGMYHSREEADQDAETLRRMNFDAWVYQMD